MHITKEQLRFDILTAYFCARKHKSNRWYVKEFEQDLENNINLLTDEIYNRIYEPSPFYVFVIKDPKVREIFAAVFKDRIVHHLYYNYVHDYFEKTFIADSYSCIKGRGTSYGIKRLRHHIESESRNYTKSCHVLKMDIKSYFININRNILLDRVLSELKKFDHKYPDCLDLDLLEYLSRVIILHDPTLNAIPVGKQELWDIVPKHKSLFNALEGCGLPLGNLTSQLFSNIYLNLLDQYIKRVLKVKHYGRYVDDFYIVCRNRSKLRGLISKIDNFLKINLGLEIHKGKTIIRDVKFGIEFLGAYLKPFRTYISNQTLRRIRSRMSYNRNKDSIFKLQSKTSMLGLLKGYSSFNIRKEIIFYGDS